MSVLDDFTAGWRIDVFNFCQVLCLRISLCLSAGTTICIFPLGVRGVGGQLGYIDFNEVFGRHGAHIGLPVWILL